MKTVIKLLKIDGSNEIIAEFDQLIIFNVGTYISNGTGTDYRIDSNGMFFTDENVMVYVIPDYHFYSL